MYAEASIMEGVSNMKMDIEGLKKDALDVLESSNRLKFKNTIEVLKTI